MYIIHLTNDDTFPENKEGFVGPFGSEDHARVWLHKNQSDGSAARIVYMCNPWEASL